jgi:hypothetical protein
MLCILNNIKMPWVLQIVKYSNNIKHDTFIYIFIYFINLHFWTCNPVKCWSVDNSIRPCVHCKRGRRRCYSWHAWSHSNIMTWIHIHSCKCECNYRNLCKRGRKVDNLTLWTLLFGAFLVVETYRSCPTCQKSVLCQSIY